MLHKLLPLKVFRALVFQVFPGLSFPGLSSSELLIIYTNFPSYPVLVSLIVECGAKEESEKKLGGKKEGVPSLSPLPHPLVVVVVFFFCSHLFALSPRSVRLEQARFFCINIHVDL